jgi:hypothetical protein
MDPNGFSGLSGAPGGGDDGPLRRSVAQFVLEHSEQIRAMARRKLTAPTRSVYDSEDVLSSVLRRMDNLARQGRLRRDSEAEMMALIATIASNAALSKSKLIERARSQMSEDGAYARELLARLDRCGDDDEATLLVLRIQASIKDQTDRQVFSLMLKGASHKAIGDLLGFSADASKQRWMKVRRELVERFSKGDLNG